jgi:hypothetical protein
LSKTNSNLSNVPSFLSSLTYESHEPIYISIGWDFEELKWHQVLPIIHLFDVSGKRLDIISTEKPTSQSVKLLDNKGSHFRFQLNMTKLPSYVDSIYISLSSLSEKLSLNSLRDFYLELTQGEESEIWGFRTAHELSSSQVIASFEKIDKTINKKGSSWTFNYLNFSIPPSYDRIHNIVTKEELISLGEVKPSFMESFIHKIITFISKMINVQ